MLSHKYKANSMVVHNLINSSVLFENCQDFFSIDGVFQNMLWFLFRVLKAGYIKSPKSAKSPSIFMKRFPLLFAPYSMEQYQILVIFLVGKVKTSLQFLLSNLRNFMFYLSYNQQLCKMTLFLVIELQLYCKLLHTKYCLKQTWQPNLYIPCVLKLRRLFCLWRNFVFTYQDCKANLMSYETVMPSN